MKFTDKYIKNLPARDKQHTVREGDGFTLRISPAGSKTWIFTYDFDKRRRNMSLGRYPSVSLSKARQLHKEARALLVQGIDPLSKRQAQKIHDSQEQKELTIQDLVTEYLEKHAKKKKASWKEDERILYKDIIPAWKNRKAKTITRREIVHLLDKIAERGGVQANRTLAVVRKMFNFAVERGILEYTPCTQVKAVVKEISRDRVLTPDEINTLWHGLDAAPMTGQLKIAFKLMLATGLRRSEVISLEHVDISNGWLTIPGNRTKNEREHRLPLNDVAKELLEELPIYNDKYFFPSRIEGKHINADALGKALKRCNFDIPHFTPHDLRRTMGTMLGELGFNRLIQDKILNHIDRTVGGIYDRHSYDSEKRSAMDAWGRRLEEIITDNKFSNVIPLSPS